MRRMAKITGRSDDMLIIRGVNVFPSQIEELVLKLPGLAPHYLLEVTRAGHLDRAAGVASSATRPPPRMPLRGRRSAGVPGGHHQGHDRHLRRAWRSRDPGALERSPGKAKRVIDKRPR